MIHGRAGKPRAHYWYIVPDPPAKASAPFKDPDKSYYAGSADDTVLLLELRLDGRPDNRAALGPPVWGCPALACLQ